MTLTAAGDILESATLISLDTTPVLMPTAGEGAAFEAWQNEDIILPTASVAQYSTYTMGPRIPTNAKIKKVELYTKGIDSNSTPTAAFDINLIFSDAPLGGIAAGAPVTDGTTQTNAGTIPTSALTGATTTITAYASPNKMFGSAFVLPGASGAATLTDITFKNTFTFADKQLPIWDVLGFAVDPGGFFNFFLVNTAAVATAASGVLGLVVTYALD
jgi:hypothetical protein